MTVANRGEGIGPLPTKALAQDQLAELQDLAKRLDDRFGVFTYDGDTPSDAHKAIRDLTQPISGKYCTREQKSDIRLGGS